MTSDQHPTTLPDSAMQETASPETASPETGPPRRPPVPGAGTLAVLALAWLLVMLSSARQAVGTSPGVTQLTVARMALELPQVISASLIAGASAGLVLVHLLTRLRPTVAARWLTRLPLTTAAGVVTGVAVAAPILAGYDHLPSILALSIAVATAAALGGLLAAVRPPVVIAAGVAGTLGMFVVGLAERAFEGELRYVFGAGDHPESVVAASGWVTLIGSLLAGVVAGLIAYLYLRRGGPPGTRWPAYLLAGGLPGLLVALAELITRLGGAGLFALFSAASPADETVLSYFHAARFNRMLVVGFTGALVAVFLLGRTLRPMEAEPDEAADHETGREAETGRAADQPSN